MDDFSIKKWINQNKTTDCSNMNEEKIPVAAVEKILPTLVDELEEHFEKLLENYTLVSNNDITDLEQAIKKLPIAGGQQKVDEARIDLEIILNNIKNSGNF